MLSIVLSYADSGEKYAESSAYPGFRARKNGGDVRVHINRLLLRWRDKYVALDIPSADFKLVADAVLVKAKKLAVKKIAKAAKTSGGKKVSKVAPKKSAKKGKK